jgi:hypothetical protein
MVGREHDAEGRDGGVEARVGKRQRLGIGGLECDLEAFGTRPFGATLEQAADIVGRGDAAACSSTRSSVFRSQASASDSPTICSVVPITA